MIWKKAIGQACFHLYHDGGVQVSACQIQPSFDGREVEREVPPQAETCQKCVQASTEDLTK